MQEKAWQATKRATKRGCLVARLVDLKVLKPLKVSRPQSPKVFKALKKPPVGRPRALEIVSCSAILCIQ